MAFGPFQHLYPYANFHDLNLDWILSACREMETKLQQFVTLNTVKYADPLQWDISRQYEQNTLVQTVDGLTYLSKKAVPVGVSVDNSEFWLKVADFSATADTIRQNIAAANEGNGTTASAPRAVGDLVWLAEYLYKITASMIAGDSYVSGSNCENVTVEELLNAILAAITAEETKRISDITMVSTGCVNVKYFGAIGDGVTDDTEAFKAAINAAEVHGTIIVPFGYYLISEELPIRKPLKIIGYYTGWDVEETTSDIPVAIFRKSAIKFTSERGFVFEILGCEIKNLSVEMVNTSATFGLAFTMGAATKTTFGRFNTVDNCTVVGNNGVGTGIGIFDCGLTRVYNTEVYGFSVGFVISGSTNTSITLQQCWCSNFTNSGYVVRNTYYSTLIDCAADTTNPNTIGYNFSNCKNISTLNCGAEKEDFGFIIDSCEECSFSATFVSDAETDIAFLFRYGGKNVLKDVYIQDTIHGNDFRKCVCHSDVKILLINTNIDNITYGGRPTQIANGGFFAGSVSFESL